ncbi:type 1 fimbrial protein [Buttiauxella sp. B2]|uniref:type 1 fimbrial protein n=1 Tax=Buttiauxella sp. B2 TaxID=2587812 RepID=UPI0011201849|nr:type 1 fimbrial protein [Buttiauxella sp. B2]TNV21902.1 type 1 fimbrial protein [Buttiauxella sp. B2]
MKTVNLKCSMLLPMLALVFPLFNAHASDGVINFRGMIVEDGCHLSPQEQSVKFSCSQSGKPVVQTVAFNQLNQFKPSSDLPFSTKLHYLNEKRTLAIVEVTYR